MKRNRPSPVAFGQSAPCAAFTLIELLVVIAVIALLMAILMPSLQYAGRKAKAITCRSKLREWGVLFYAYIEDNDSRFLDVHPSGGYPDWCKPMAPSLQHPRSVDPGWRGDARELAPVDARIQGLLTPTEAQDVVSQQAPVTA